MLERHWRVHGVYRTCLDQPATGKVWGLDLPVVTIRDMVRAQAIADRSPGHREIILRSGRSMGGMQVLQWVASYPDRVYCALPIATASRHTAQNIAFHEVGRQAVMADPDWREANTQTSAVSQPRAWRS